jgi:hypothetical protein
MLYHRHSPASPSVSVPFHDHADERFAEIRREALAPGD